MMNRPLTNIDVRIISLASERLDPERKRQLLLDMENATVIYSTDEGGLVSEFEISGYLRPPTSGQRSFGAQGELFDIDGAYLSFDLFADESGRLFIIDIVRWDDGAIMDPKWETLLFY